MSSIKVECIGTAPIKAYADSAGFDLFYQGEEPIVIPVGKIETVPLLRVNVPKGYRLDILGRSGLTLKGLFVQHGVVDAGYQGMVKAMVYNANKDEDFTVEKDMKICQGVFTMIPDIEFVEVENFSDTKTERGEKGFGSSGLVREKPAKDLVEDTAKETVKDPFQFLSKLAKKHSDGIVDEATDEAVKDLIKEVIGSASTDPAKDPKGFLDEIIKDLIEKAETRFNLK